jgi:hypothetical protein
VNSIRLSPDPENVIANNKFKYRLLDIINGSISENAMKFFLVCLIFAFTEVAHAKDINEWTAGVLPEFL